MRRRVVFTLVLALGIPLLLSGCGNKEEAPVPELILRYADNQPEDYPTTTAARYFAELVEEATEGRVCIRVFANGELGDEISIFEQVQFGGIDFARTSSGILGEFSPEAEILQLPYLFTDSEHMWRVLDGEIGDEFLAMLRDTGVVGLSWFDAGARNIYTRRPVSTIEDLSGLNIRVQESNFMGWMVELWGATPVQIPYSGVYSALQTGKIDGAENNWSSYESTGHFETAPYYLLDAHLRLPEVQIVSEISLEKIRSLDESYVDVILRCARESARYERELWEERETESERIVRERGCVVTELSAAEWEKFRLAVQPMYESYDGELTDLIHRIQNS